MWGADEVLARRLAALRALSANRDSKPAATAMPLARESGGPAAPGQAQESEASKEEKKEWSILF